MDSFDDDLAELGLGLESVVPQNAVSANAVPVQMAATAAINATNVEYVRVSDVGPNVAKVLRDAEPVSHKLFAIGTKPTSATLTNITGIITQSSGKCSDMQVVNGFSAFCGTVKGLPLREVLKPGETVPVPGPIPADSNCVLSEVAQRAFPTIGIDGITDERRDKICRNLATYPGRLSAFKSLHSGLVLIDDNTDKFGGKTIPLQFGVGLTNISVNMGKRKPLETERIYDIKNMFAPAFTTRYGNNGSYVFKSIARSGEMGVFENGTPSMHIFEDTGSGSVSASSIVNSVPVRDASCSVVIAGAFGWEKTHASALINPGKIPSDHAKSLVSKAFAPQYELVQEVAEACFLLPKLAPKEPINANKYKEEATGVVDAPDLPRMDRAKGGLAQLTTMLTSKDDMTPIPFNMKGVREPIERPYRKASYNATASVVFTNNRVHSVLHKPDGALMGDIFYANAAAVGAYDAMVGPTHILGDTHRKPVQEDDYKAFTDCSILSVCKRPGLCADDIKHHNKPSISGRIRSERPFVFEALFQLSVSSIAMVKSVLHTTEGAGRAVAPKDIINASVSACVPVTMIGTNLTASIGIDTSSTAWLLLNTMGRSLPIVAMGNVVNTPTGQEWFDNDPKNKAEKKNLFDKGPSKIAEYNESYAGIIRAKPLVFKGDYGKYISPENPVNEGCLKASSVASHQSMVCRIAGMPAMNKILGFDPNTAYIDFDASKAFMYEFDSALVQKLLSTGYIPSSVRPDKRRVSEAVPMYANALMSAKKRYEDDNMGDKPPEYMQRVQNNSANAKPPSSLCTENYMTVTDSQRIQCLNQRGAISPSDLNSGKMYVVITDGSHKKALHGRMNPDAFRGGAAIRALAAAIGVSEDTILNNPVAAHDNFVRALASDTVIVIYDRVEVSGRSADADDDDEFDILHGEDTGIAQPEATAPVAAAASAAAAPVAAVDDDEDAVLDDGNDMAQPSSAEEDVEQHYDEDDDAVAEEASHEGSSQKENPDTPKRKAQTPIADKSGKKKAKK
jgi:hypothetical protein